MRRVDRQRGEDWEHLGAEEQPQLVALGKGHLVPTENVDALGVERWLDRAVEQSGLALHEVGALGVDALEDLAWHETRRGPHGDAGGDPSLEAGDPDHEELVEVAGEDREELGPLEQRDRVVLGQLEHALVEGEPRQLTVEEPALGQRNLRHRCIVRGCYLCAHGAHDARRGTGAPTARLTQRVNSMSTSHRVKPRLV